jgi:hypothetical protein
VTLSDLSNRTAATSARIDRLLASVCPCAAEAAARTRREHGGAAPQLAPGQTFADLCGAIDPDSRVEER